MTQVPNQPLHPRSLFALYRLEPAHQLISSIENIQSDFRSFPLVLGIVVFLRGCHDTGVDVIVNDGAAGRIGCGVETLPLAISSLSEIV